MALSSTVYHFEIALSDVDRGVYEALSLDVARHPSETAESLVTRVLAYALEADPGLAFGPGLSSADEPSLAVRDLTGRLVAWIDVGTPSADRLHKASKACDRVVVYCHKAVDRYLESLAGERVHAPERVAIVAVDRALVDALAAGLQRRTALALTVTEGVVYVDAGGRTYTAAFPRHPLRSP